MGSSISMRSPRAIMWGVGGDVGGVVGGGHGHAVGHAAGLNLGGVEMGGPVSHNLVDLVAVGRPVAGSGEPGVVEQVGAVHGRTQAGEVGLHGGDDAHPAAVTAGVVVERGGVVEPVAGAGSHQAEMVVGGVGPLQNAQDRAVQEGIDHAALAGAASGSVALVEQGGGGLGSEHPQ